MLCLTFQLVFTEIQKDVLIKNSFQNDREELMKGDDIAYRYFHNKGCFVKM